MPKPLAAVIAQIADKKIPAVILVGGSSNFLAEDAFHDLRDAIVAAKPGITIEGYEAGSELAAILDSYRTSSLFASARLIVVSEVNAFVSAKELSSLYDKAVVDWKSAKTDKKRSSSAAKLLHVIGLAGADFDMTDKQIATSFNVSLDPILTDMLAFCRTTGKKASRGEDDAALLIEAVTRGGAPNTYMLMRSGEIPRESATIDLIDRNGVVVVMDLTRDTYAGALERAIAKVAEDAQVRFDGRALSAMRQRLGIERLLADKFSKEVPDLRIAVSEAERLATLAGVGGRVTAEMVEREVATVEGGARYEFGSLFTEGKIVEAIAKLRDLVAQARREDPKVPIEIQYGKFLFPLADELRQMIGIVSFARTQRIDLKAQMNYNRFKDTLSDRLGESLKANGLVRQKPHPFPLHKKWEAARNQNEASLFRALAALADLEIKRKSGGIPADLGIETFLLSRIRA